MTTSDSALRALAAVVYEQDPSSIYVNVEHDDDGYRATLYRRPGRRERGDDCPTAEQALASLRIAIAREARSQIAAAEDRVRALHTALGDDAPIDWPVSLSGARRVR